MTLGRRQRAGAACLRAPPTPPAAAVAWVPNVCAPRRHTALGDVPRCRGPCRSAGSVRRGPMCVVPQRRARPCPSRILHGCGRPSRHEAWRRRRPTAVHRGRLAPPACTRTSGRRNAQTLSERRHGASSRVARAHAPGEVVGCAQVWRLGGGVGAVRERRCRRRKAAVDARCGEAARAAAPERPPEAAMDRPHGNWGGPATSGHPTSVVDWRLAVSYQLDDRLIVSRLRSIMWE